MRFIALLLFSIIQASVHASVLLFDSEISNGIREIVCPIAMAANMNCRKVNVHVILDDQINAFVTSGRDVYVYAGLLKKFANVEVLQGVFAHELGHVLAGHVAKIDSDLRRMSAESILTQLLGVAAMATSKSQDAGMALLLGGSHVAKQKFLRHARVYERSADKIAAELMHRSGISISGAVEFFVSATSSSGSFDAGLCQYAITHPLTHERLSYMTAEMKHQVNVVSNRAAQETYDRVIAKLKAFTTPINQLPLRLRSGSSAACIKYAEAITAYRRGDMSGALAQISQLIAQRPNDPYLHQTKAQFLFRAGKINESLAEYRSAVSYLPQDLLLKLEVAEALTHSAVGLKGNERVERAKEALVFLDNLGGTDHAYAWRLRAAAYGRIGDHARRNFALAEEALLLGDFDSARRLALLAKRFALDDVIRLKIADMLELLKTTQGRRDG